jgi:hypothetical protein
VTAWINEKAVIIKFSKLELERKEAPIARATKRVGWERSTSLNKGTKVGGFKGQFQWHPSKGTYLFNLSRNKR